VAFTYVGGATNGGDPSSSVSVTHGLTINSGDLVVAYANVNGPQTVSIDSGGASWTEALNATVGGETARHALWWKVADGSEPSSYSITLGASDSSRLVVKVFRPGSGTPEVDAAVNAPARTGSAYRDMVCNAVDGEIISNDAVSVVFGGKDRRVSGGETYTVADNSYTGAVGNVSDQMAAGAHRIYTTGTTFSGDVRIETADGNDGGNDAVYSVHISFVEGASSGTDALLADDVESASEVTSPAIGQEHALTSTDVESASEVTSPSLAETQALLAEDVESASEVSAPALAERHNLAAVDVESASEVTTPAVGQKHALTAGDVESASEVTSPAISTDGTDGLLAEDVESASQVSVPVIGQAHALLAGDVQSLSEVSVPALNGASAPDLPPARRRFRPVWEMTGPTPT